MNRRAMVLVAAGLVCLVACSRGRKKKGPTAPRPPDLLAGKTGGAAALKAETALQVFPSEATAIGVYDPTQLFTDKRWLALAPPLVQEIGRLRVSGFDPTKTRLFFFVLPEPKGSGAIAVVADGKLSGVAGARQVKAEGIEVHRFDGAGTGIAWPAKVTVVGREPALQKALQLAKQPAQRLSKSPRFEAFRGVLDRLPATSLVRVCGVMTPRLVGILSRGAAQGEPAVAQALRALATAQSYGAAIYLLGASVRGAIVLRFADDKRAAKSATAIRAGLTAARLPAGEVPSALLGAVIEMGLAGAEVEQRDRFVLVQTALPGERLARAFMN